MRQIGTDKDKVTVCIGPDMIPDKPLPGRVQRQGQLKPGMMVPLKGDALVQSAVQHGQR